MNKSGSEELAESSWKLKVVDGVHMTQTLSLTEQMLDSMHGQAP